MLQPVLVHHGYVEIPQGTAAVSQRAAVATVVSNMAALGFAPDPAALQALQTLSQVELTDWWWLTEPILESTSGADRRMQEHVVYRNFPAEVLAKDAVDYVFEQIRIYMGADLDEVREPVAARGPSLNLSRLKVLARSGQDTAGRIADALRRQPSRWNDAQRAGATILFADDPVVDPAAFAFRENGIATAATRFTQADVRIQDATDVLRLAVALSGGDPSLREATKLRAFTRAERRRLLSLLEGCDRLADDVAERPERFKRLFERLRAGDYAARFPKVVQAVDDLRNGRLVSFGARVDPQVKTADVMDAASERPGVFLRRFHEFHGLFGNETTERLLPLLDRLATRQLVAFSRYVSTVNGRGHMIAAPKGRWSRAQVRANVKSTLDEATILAIETRIGSILADRLASVFPEGVLVDHEIERVKLQTNDQKLADYGRGTRLPIPESVGYLRTASYWKLAQDRPASSVWFDNGWNLFDRFWQPMGNVSWDQGRFETGEGVGGLFSGDPTTAFGVNEACQMIDLYPDVLRASGVRFAVWSVLCYSRKRFSEAREVLATLSWGADPQAGELYDPAAAQMVFPLRSDDYTSFVAYVDLEEREIVYMDAPLKGQVSSAGNNGTILSKTMPAYVEYLDAQPSLWDVARHMPYGRMPVLFSDHDHPVEHHRAFVFRPENAQNSFERVQVVDFVG